MHTKSCLSLGMREDIRRDEMLRINTPGGLFTVREGDVSPRPALRAIWDVLRKDGKIVHYSNTLAVEELVHCLRGEPHYWWSAFFVIEDLANRGAHYITQPFLECKMISLVCNNGTMSYPESLLRRRFQLIDDFLTDNPSETQIAIPYSAREMQNAIEASDLVTLTDIYDLLAHLNPKNNTYYFYFSLANSIPATLLDLASRFTREERTNLLHYGLRKKAVIPNTELPFTLSLFHSVEYTNKSLMETIYKERYPGYLFCKLYHRAEQHFALLDCVESLFSWDFTADKDDAYYDESVVVETIYKVMEMSREIVFSLEQLGVALNRDAPTTLPYGVTLPSRVIDTEELLD